MKKWISGCLLALATLLATVAQSAELAPDALARSVTDEVLAIVRGDKDIQAGNSRKVLELVETKVLPHFNFTRMTRLAVGPAWRQATGAQQQSLTNEFRALLVHTYTNAFTQYRDQVVEYRPLKLAPGATDVVVRSIVKQKVGDPIDINYSMEKTENGWKVYDVIIAGVSLVQNYRSTFNAEIQKAGVDGLIKTLAEKNKALAQQSGRK